MGVTCPGMEKKQLNVWVALDLAERVEAAAASDDRSVSAWIRRLLLREIMEAQGAAELVTADGDSA